MGRKSAIPTFNTTAAARRALLSVRPDTIVSRDQKSGGEWHYLTSFLHDLDPRCVVCDLPTIRSRWSGPMVAEIGLLIPSSFLRAATLRAADLDSTDDEAHADAVGDVLDGMAHKGYRLSRLGYVPGNVALMCAACIDAGNAHRAAVGFSPVLDARDLAGGARVLSAWPALRREVAPAGPTPAEARALHGAAATHKAAARASRASQGMPY